MTREELKQAIDGRVFEQAPLAVALIDRDYRIALANPRFYEVFGRAEGQHCYVAYKQDTGPCDDCATHETFTDGATRTVDQMGVGSDGRPVHYRVKLVPVREGEKTAYVLHLALETTRAAELEKALSQAERLANVGLTTAGLAHTIKNILAGLEGGIYVVDSGFEHDDTQRLRDGWALVRRYVDQVGALVRNLLRYAKAEPPEKQQVDPGELVREVIALHESKAGLVGIALEARVGQGLSPLWADREALHAALTNLVSNAFDACTWDPDDEKSHRVVVEATPGEDGGVCFTVTDNGPGIAEENQPKIFEALYTTKGMSGTGLGLLLTKKAVQEHGGRVDFSSTPGVQTTFRIELPTRG